MQLSAFKVNFEDIMSDQFGIFEHPNGDPSFVAKDVEIYSYNVDDGQKFQRGIGPYFENRLFNPDMPVTLETGLEVSSLLKITRNLDLAGSVRKSILTNLTKNNRLDSGSKRQGFTLIGDTMIYMVSQVTYTI